jgi:hypothetical protein
MAAMVESALMSMVFISAVVAVGRPVTATHTQKIQLVMVVQVDLVVEVMEH